MCCYYIIPFKIKDLLLDTSSFEMKSEIKIIALVNKVFKEVSILT